MQPEIDEALILLQNASAFFINFSTQTKDFKNYKKKPIRDLKCIALYTCVRHKQQRRKQRIITKKQQYEQL